MNNNGANEVAYVLLHVFCEGDPTPQWKKLPRQVKDQLMKTLGEKNYNNIHDPRLYKELDRLWNSRKNLKEQEIIDRAKLSAKVECAICMETYDGDGKVTTLLCGHKFCSMCILQHMRTTYRPQCPMCRRDVFDLEPVVVPVPEPTVHVREEDLDVAIALERKREKRRLERRTKRMHRRECKGREGNKPEALRNSG